MKETKILDFERGLYLGGNLRYIVTNTEGGYKFTSQSSNSFCYMLDYEFIISKDELEKLLKAFNVAENIMSFPLQISKDIAGSKYIFAHAMSSDQEEIKDDSYYLMGNDIDFMYLKNGIDGAICINGHNHTSLIREWYGDEYRPRQNEIWHNPKENVYMIDCGSGFSTGRLACLRLEDKEEFYS